MAAVANNQSPDQDQRVDFAEAKAWIAAQEAYEATTSKPAPLTPAQRKALAQLKLPAAVPQRIDLGDKDCVSLILRYRDAHPHDGVAISFTEPESQSPNGPFLITCNFSESNPPETRSFPGPRTGFVELAASAGAAPRYGPPRFTRKKEAKHYAARCCAEWLMSTSRMPPVGEYVVSSAPAVSTLAPGPSALSPVRSSPSPASADSSPSPRCAARTSVAAGAAVDVRDDDLTATRRVDEMCRRLGMQAPRYELHPADGGNAADGLWSGGPDFRNSVFWVPEDVGRVEKIYGKRSAREKIAEEVLPYLFKIEAERKAELELFMNR